MFKSNGGFTLVELIIVIVILAILAAVAIPSYGAYVSKAEDAQKSVNAGFDRTANEVNEAWGEYKTGETIIATVGENWTGEAVNP